MSAAAFKAQVTDREEQLWHCPYCGKQIDQYGACCGEKGHAEQENEGDFDEPEKTDGN